MGQTVEVTARNSTPTNATASKVSAMAARLSGVARSYPVNLGVMHAVRVTGVEAL